MINPNAAIIFDSSELGTRRVRSNAYPVSGGIHIAVSNLGPSRPRIVRRPNVAAPYDSSEVGARRVRSNAIPVSEGTHIAVSNLGPSRPRIVRRPNVAPIHDSCEVGAPEFEVMPYQFWGPYEAKLLLVSVQVVP